MSAGVSKITRTFSKPSRVTGTGRVTGLACLDFSKARRVSASGNCAMERQNNQNRPAMEEKDYFVFLKTIIIILLD